MCGPLAITFAGGAKDSVLYRSISYNIGKTFSYVILGLFFGLIGNLFFLMDIQKVLSVGIGVIMILSFFVNVESKLLSVSVLSEYYNKFNQKLLKLFSSAQKKPAFLLGMLNGFLPCGLVYLALAGALSTGHIGSGMSFMLFFGVGTMPMMFFVIFGESMLRVRHRKILRKVIPYVSLFFGFFMVYRGLAIEIPTELNFWESVKNPIMCH